MWAALWEVWAAGRLLATSAVVVAVCGVVAAVVVWLAGRRRS